MELIGKLKNEVESAPTKEEKKEAIEKAGMLLTDDELDQVAGGVGEDYHCTKPSCPVRFGSQECYSCKYRKKDNNNNNNSPWGI